MKVDYVLSETALVKSQKEMSRVLECTILSAQTGPGQDHMNGVFPPQY
jgi:hypothetical protein